MNTNTCRNFVAWASQHPVTNVAAVVATTSVVQGQNRRRE